MTFVKHETSVEIFSTPLDELIDSLQARAGDETRVRRKEYATVRAVLLIQQRGQVLVWHVRQIDDRDLAGPDVGEVTRGIGGEVCACAKPYALFTCARSGAVRLGRWRFVIRTKCIKPGRLTAAAEVFIYDAGDLPALANAGSIPQQKSRALVAAIRKRDVVAHRPVHDRLEL